MLNQPSGAAIQRCAGSQSIAAIALPTTPAEFKAMTRWHNEVDVMRCNGGRSVRTIVLKTAQKTVGSSTYVMHRRLRPAPGLAAILVLL